MSAEIVPVKPSTAPQAAPSAAPKPSTAPSAPKPTAASRDSTVSSMAREESCSTVDYREKGPSRQPSAASTVDYRSRSRGEEPTFQLPVKGGTRTRGRSPPAMKSILEDIAKSQNRELVKGQMRVELGRFAKSFANARQTRPISQPKLATRTFDELVGEETQPPPGKQRISSEGLWRPRVRHVG